jgi:glyoxylase-like metal-dependent hydrolase (beta-lactamase superfamily II)/rhodanese-related sulfurtransferase
MVELFQGDQVRKLILDETPNVLFLDVRSYAEVLSAGAYPAPFQNVPIKYLQERHLPSDKAGKVVFTCASGGRALGAAEQAVKWGFTNVFVLDSGIQGWISAGFTLEKGFVRPTTHVFFEGETSTCQYVVVDEETKESVIIDPVLDFNPASGQISTKSADVLLDFVKKWGLNVSYILETHAHADHLTAAQYLKAKLDSPKVCIGEKIMLVQETFSKVFNVSIPVDGSQFDHLWTDKEEFIVGKFNCKAIHTPGHTPDSMSYVIGGSVYCGDTVFLPDVGSARCDFPSGSSSALFLSVREKLFGFPDEYHIYIGHDYPPTDIRKTPQFFTSVSSQKASNKHLKELTSMEEFIEMRNKRDATLGAPRLLMASLQFNMRAGHFPRAEENGTAYVKIPLKYSGGICF